MPFSFLPHRNSWSFLCLNIRSFQYLASAKPLILLWSVHCPTLATHSQGYTFDLLFTNNYNFSIIPISSVPLSNHCLVSQPNPSVRQFLKPTKTSDSLVLHVAPYILTAIESVESMENDFNHFLAYTLNSFDLLLLRCPFLADLNPSDAMQLPVYSMHPCQLFDWWKTPSKRVTLPLNWWPLKEALSAGCSVVTASLSSLFPISLQECLLSFPLPNFQHLLPYSYSQWWPSSYFTEKIEAIKKDLSQTCTLQHTYPPICTHTHRLLSRLSLWKSSACSCLSPPRTVH